MTLKFDRRVVDEIVKFATRDARADGDVLVQLVRHFPPKSKADDNIDEAVNHMLRMLRNYVALDIFWPRRRRAEASKSSP